MKQCYMEKPTLFLGNATTKASSKNLSEMSMLHKNKNNKHLQSACKVLLLYECQMKKRQQLVMQE